jgi:SPP1 gp7 family putative phage head morphogenesis protein
MALVVRRGLEALRAAVLGMPLADFAKAKVHTDAADGSPPEPKLPAFAGILAKAKAAIRGASLGVAGKVQKNSQSEFKRLGIDLRTEEPKLGKLIDGWRAQNVERVTSLLEHERDELADILAKGWGKSVPELRDRIEERLEVSRNKADLLARDQVLTLNAQVTEARHKAAGIEEYIWTSAGDERVRESHDAMDGERCRWDDPPEVDGERVHPGQPINCRCIAHPILPELEDVD